MTNQFINATYKKPQKILKNKNLRTDLLLMQMFSFTYVGKADIWIQKHHKKFEVIISGVHFFDDIFVFAPHYKHVYKFESLYNAILCFNKAVQFITSSMDWYSPEIFESNLIYNEVTSENVY